MNKLGKGAGLSFGCAGLSLAFCVVLSYSPATCVVLHVGVQGVPAGKLCTWRDWLPLCASSRQHNDWHKRQHRNRVYGLHKRSLHEGEMQIFSPSCTFAGQNQSGATSSQPGCGGSPGSCGSCNCDGKWWHIWLPFFWQKLFDAYFASVKCCLLILSSFCLFFWYNIRIYKIITNCLMGGSTVFLYAVFLSKTVKRMTLYTTSVLCLDYMLNLPLIFPNRNKTAKLQCSLEDRGTYAVLSLWWQIYMWKYGRKGGKAKRELCLKDQ